MLKLFNAIRIELLKNITKAEATARDLVYVHSNLKLLQKLQSVDYQEANIE